MEQQKAETKGVAYSLTSEDNSAYPVQPRERIGLPQLNQQLVFAQLLPRAFMSGQRPTSLCTIPLIHPHPRQSAHQILFVPAKYVEEQWRNNEKVEEHVDGDGGETKLDHERWVGDEHELSCGGADVCVTERQKKSQRNSVPENGRQQLM